MAKRHQGAMRRLRRSPAVRVHHKRSTTHAYGSLTSCWRPTWWISAPCKQCVSSPPPFLSTTRHIAHIAGNVVHAPFCSCTRSPFCLKADGRALRSGRSIKQVTSQPCCRPLGRGSRTTLDRAAGGCCYDTSRPAVRARRQRCSGGGVSTQIWPPCTMTLTRARALTTILQTSSRCAALRLCVVAASC